MGRKPTSRVLRGVRLPVLALGLLVLPALLLLLVSLVTPCMWTAMSSTARAAPPC
ncbi:hypothetical protein O1M63_38800 [Streptomyces mirabilis]|nr:hypothetical protein [Streptomyces mirabilis]